MAGSEFQTYGAMKLNKHLAKDLKLSTHKGVNQRSKDVTQTQQQRPDLPTVALTWHACKIQGT